ncbi:23S rRNA m(2)G-1835 methyltransferase / 16S rRNA m(2)G 1207 methyltransferase [Magnetococcus marinus MC-1]|uniref:Ribosomal RNA large subunit methyltransferase G n=1 Tax=Magnetococcus marinus (strain ATCC BAA-1437 / JCM 17883 / MC-1) TaxID=156889 RepID=RLMG_MAGMM|nr:methyltransferase [Magnetococcus marinus]A0L9S5.1 RecName: Full=Ribosomal RNA large subunit methyltransferase G; AltName: Full=23S rRNA m2G1835 methyltransferase; AltName: Full=rRNA (guanine-N(2)-)-methyltransferase RlmG [Magnetococcus marinus MC-1]ABK44718.1 23S rRNA m(2)G-1835 methyltransferase / 16S rRNA m(2)G 1207 methyltransferase [Magnetococcus marinus MC-1]
MQHLNIHGHTLTLRRFPHKPGCPLQAWDAADALALTNHALPDGEILILNDHFGALACGLAYPERTLEWVNDSYMAHQALAQNLQLNRIETPLHRTPALAASPTNPVGILIKLPRMLQLLSSQLDWLNLHLPKGTPVVIAARQKDMPSTLPDLTRRLLDDVHPSRAEKKARLIFGQLSGRQSGQAEITAWHCAELDCLLSHYPNVFGRQKLDLGARVLLQNLGTIPDQVVDLGCGNGVLSIAALQRNPNSHVLAVDESWQATRSCQINLERVRTPEHFKVVWGHSLSFIEGMQADLVLCNPPFHQHQTLTDDIAWCMFKDAHRVLKPGGRLRMVGNRHLGYHAKLHKLFGHCRSIAATPKFVVLESVKSS